MPLYRRSTLQLIYDKTPDNIIREVFLPLHVLFRVWLPAPFILLYRVVKGSEIPILFISFAAVPIVKEALLTIPWIATKAAGMSSFKLVTAISAFSPWVAGSLAIVLSVAAILGPLLLTEKAQEDKLSKGLIIGGLVTSALASLTGLPLILTPAFIASRIFSISINLATTILGSSLFRFIASSSCAKLFLGAGTLITISGHVLHTTESEDPDKRYIRFVKNDSDIYIKNKTYKDPLHPYNTWTTLTLNMRNFFPDLFQRAVTIADATRSGTTYIPNATHKFAEWTSGNKLSREE